VFSIKNLILKVLICYWTTYQKIRRDRLTDPVKFMTNNKLTIFIPYDKYLIERTQKIVFKCSSLSVVTV